MCERVWGADKKKMMKSKESSHFGLRSMFSSTCDVSRLHFTHKYYQNEICVQLSFTIRSNPLLTSIIDGAASRKHIKINTWGAFLAPATLMLKVTIINDL